MKRVLPLLWLGLIAASSASAAPGPVTTYLMNEPASLLDIGIMKLQLALNHPYTTRYGDRYAVSVDYEYEENKVDLIATLASARLKESDIRNSCHDIVSQLKRNVGVDPDTGKGQLDKHSYLGALYFGHNGYIMKPTNAPTDDAINETLDNMTYITVMIEPLSGRHHKTVGNPVVRCKSDLMSTEIFYSTK